MKRVVAALMAVMLLAAGVTFAESEETEKDILDRIRVVQDFKFKVHKDGLGSDVTAPVYTAPSVDSFRCANGKAAWDLSMEVSESNYVDKNWLFIRYRVDKPNKNDSYDRVGYVQGKYVKDFISGMPKLTFEHIPLTAAEDMEITDDPVLKGTPFGTIRRGETFYVLMKYTYTGNWYYVECVIDGKTARGFIDRTKAKFCLGENADLDSGARVYDLETIGYPDVSPRNTTATGHVEISGKTRKGVKREADTKADQISVAYPGGYYPCYDSAPAKWRNGVWYYVWVEEDSEWGWILGSDTAVYVEDK